MGREGAGGRVSLWWEMAGAARLRGQGGLWTYLSQSCSPDLTWAGDHRSRGAQDTRAWHSLTLQPRDLSRAVKDGSGLVCSSWGLGSKIQVPETYSASHPAR